MDGFQGKRVLIYGAGMIGKRLLAQFNARGIPVVGFLDRRGSAIREMEGIVVYTGAEAARLEDKEQYAIFVTVKNVFQHTDIVRGLRELGFRYFVFKPLAVLRGCNTSPELSLADRIYEAVVEQEGYEEQEIPSMTGVRLSEVKDWALISREGELVRAYIPAELLFTNSNPDNPHWSVKNMLACYTAVDMYRGFRGNGACGCDCDKLVAEYVRKIALPGARKMGLNTEGGWEKGVIQGRLGVYQEMKRKLALHPQFFVEHCPFVRWMDGKGFELISSGKNRISFLIAQGMEYIPVKMKREDYDGFLAGQKAEGILRYLEEHSEFRLFAPVPHPYFYYHASFAAGYVECWLERIGRFLSRWLYETTQGLCFEKISMLSMLYDQGCSSRFFTAAGYRVTEYDSSEDALRKLLDGLAGVDYPAIRQWREEDGGFDIFLLDSRRYRKERKQEIWGACSLFCFLQVYGHDRGLLEEAASEGFAVVSQLFACDWGMEPAEGYLLVKTRNNGSYINEDNKPEEYRKYLFL